MTKQTTVPRRSANMSHALRIFEIDSSAIASYNSGAQGVGTLPTSKADLVGLCGRCRVKGLLYV